jgi:hypothetical protein
MYSDVIGIDGKTGISDGFSLRLLPGKGGCPA